MAGDSTFKLALCLSLLNGAFSFSPRSFGGRLSTVRAQVFVEVHLKELNNKTNSPSPTLVSCLQNVNSFPYTYHAAATPSSVTPMGS